MYPRRVGGGAGGAVGFIENRVLSHCDAKQDDQSSYHTNRSIGSESSLLSLDFDGRSPPQLSAGDSSPTWLLITQHIRYQLVLII